MASFMCPLNSCRGRLLCHLSGSAKPIHIFAGDVTYEPLLVGPGTAGRARGCFELLGEGYMVSPGSCLIVRRGFTLSLSGAKHAHKRPSNQVRVVDGSTYRSSTPCLSLTFKYT